MVENEIITNNNNLERFIMNNQSESHHDDIPLPPIKRARTNNNIDRVVLNVGGTTIITSKSTLIRSSLYFERLFSKEWEYDHNDDEIFLDHDSHDFQILLSYMRLGQIRSNVITSSVLLLANYLGMEKLLMAVRITAKRMSFAGDNTLLKAAVMANLISKVDAEIQKDFASLLIFNNPLIQNNNDNGIRENNNTILSLPARIRAPIDNPPKSIISVISALNWLHRNGYTLLEEDLSVDETSIQHPTLVSHIRFSRLVEDEVGIAEDLDGVIITSNERCTSIFQQREFALFMERHPYRNNNNNTSDCSIETETVVSQNEPSNNNNNSKKQKQKRNIFIIDNVDTVEGMNILQTQGYVQKETQIEHWYRKALRTSNQILLYNNEDIISVQIWSRRKKKL